MSHIDFDSAILAARFTDGGHLVNGEDSMRLPCGSCVGRCPVPAACHIPESDAATRRPSLSRRARNCLLLAAIGGGGVLVCGVAELFHRFS